MYNRLFLYLTENNLLYNKQFGFQKGHSTDHAIVQLADQIHEMFNKTIFTLSAFIDLSKAFDTVNHKILLKKLSHHGIKNKSLDWFICYLSNKLQFIGYNVNSKSTFLDIVCGVPQGSILGPLLFLLYINDIRQASKLLDSIMFAGKTKFTLFHKVRQRDNIPIVLPTLKISTALLKRVHHVKFLGV